MADLQIPDGYAPVSTAAASPSQGGLQVPPGYEAAPQPDPGYLSRIGSDLSKRNDQVNQAVGQFGVGPSSLLAGVGKGVAGSISDIGGETIKSAYNSLPDDVTKPFNDTAKALANSDAGQYVAGEAGKLKGKYDQFAQNNPKTANALESTGDIANAALTLLPAAKAVSGPAKALGAIGDETEAALGNAAKGPPPPAPPGAEPAFKSIFQAGPKAAVVSKADAGADTIQKQLLSDAQVDPREVAKFLEEYKGNLPLNALDVAQRDEMGDPTGAGNILRMVKVAGQKPGEASLDSQAITKRGMMQRDQINQTLDNELSADSPYQLHDEAMMKLHNEGKAAQDAAFSQAPVTSERLEDMLEDPLLQQGIQHGIRTQQIFSRGDPLHPFDPLDFNVKFDEKGMPDYEGVPSMRTLDAGRKGLGALLDAGGDGITNPTTGAMTERGAAIANMKSNFTDELKSLNPQYDKYLDTVGDPMERMAAATKGLNFMNDRPEEINDFLNGNSARFRAGLAPKLYDPASDGATASYKASAREAMADKLADSKDDAAVLDKIWKQYTRNRLAPMVGDEGMERLNNEMQLHRAMMQSNRAFGGSDTFSNFAANDMLNDATGNPLTQHAASAVRFGAHPMRSTLDMASSTLEDMAKNSKMKMSNDVASRLIKDYSSRDPQVWYDLADRLDKLPKK